MRVLNVITTRGTRQGNLFCIEFETENLITVHQTVKILYENKTCYFEVCEVATSIYGEKLKVKAMEVGYYNLLSKVGNFDIRKLRQKEILIVTDKEELGELAHQKCYM